MEKQFERCKELLEKKGHDYTDGIDRYFNFTSIAKHLDVSPFQVWSIYFLKHIYAITTFCARGRVESEPLEDRITDAINYLLLLKGMLKEPAWDVHKE